MSWDGPGSNSDCVREYDTLRNLNPGLKWLPTNSMLGG